MPVADSVSACHRANHSVDEAAAWYAANADKAERPLVPFLHLRLGLTPAEACAALTEGGLQLRHGKAAALAATAPGAGS